MNVVNNKPKIEIMKTKVLIAHDSPFLVSTISELMGRMFNLITASSGEETVQVATVNPDTNIILLNKSCWGNGGIITILRGTCPESKIILFSGGVLETEDPAKYSVDAVLNTGDVEDLRDLIEDLLAPSTEKA